jgi:hypothetical protein
VWSDRLARRSGPAARLKVGAVAGVTLAACAIGLAAAPSAA